MRDEDRGARDERMNSYRELTVWQLGMQIAREVYGLANSFPKNEQYGITSQVQRAAVSIPSNIAEGHARDSTKEYLRHLSIARGSLAELETLMLLCRDFGYANTDDCSQMMARLDELSRMLRGLQNSLRRKLDNLADRSAPIPRSSPHDPRP